MLQTTKVDVRDLANLSDQQMMKVLFSSADYFPGLYRYTLGTLPFPHDNLDGKGLYAAFIQQAYGGKQWTRRQWFDQQIQTHLNTMEDGRNYDRIDQELADDLSARALCRFMLPTRYALAAIDIKFHVEKISPGVTYMMMGSLIRFEHNATYVGYDDLMQTYTFELKVPYVDVMNYIHSIMTQADISSLFQRGKIIAHLTFNPSNGHIDAEEQTLQQETLFQCPVFATPLAYEPPLPIKYAKLLGLSNVTRL